MYEAVSVLKPICFETGLSGLIRERITKELRVGLGALKPVLMPVQLVSPHLL